MPAVQEVTSSSLRTLLARWEAARSRTDELFGIVRPQFLYERPIPERHRIVFYVGHLEAFDANLLLPALGLSSRRRELDQLFAFGIDPVDGKLPHDQPADWPVIEQVHEYCREIRNELTGAASARDDHSELELLLNVAIEHRLMHAETLAYMFHQLPLAQKIPSGRAVSRNGDVSYNQMIEIPGSHVTLGLQRDSGIFGWDNEFEAHEVEVQTFAIQRDMVTNWEYLDFIRAGGYQEKSLWSDEDWSWLIQNGISHPVFWKKSGDAWLWRGMFQEFALPSSWPVYVSHAEASAYTRWSGKSLPTEAQWHRAAYGTRGENQQSYPWGERAPMREDGNFDFASWEPVPVIESENESPFGVRGMLGNGWEWTSTPFAPFAGFKQFSFYPGYSANFFDGQHYVMKGGSARTAACMLRPTFRNWFQPRYQYVYAGFRCVEG